MVLESRDTLGSAIGMLLLFSIFVLGWAAPVSAHPMHSEAIERACTIENPLSQGPGREGRCSFFSAAGYLVFQMDIPASQEAALPDTLSGAFMLEQASGSISDASGQVLVSGPVTFADNSADLIHMAPGTLAEWENGYLLSVSGPAIAADGQMASAPQAQSATLAQQDFFSYLKQGFLHVIPLGFDHILFVVGLFLLSPKPRDLLVQISAFTAAHTLTLALGAAGLVNIPAYIVEPLIALSIAWVAFENVIRARVTSRRVLLVFCFGLLHGLGFAGALKALGLSGVSFFSSLIAFNVGVELGQLSVIALCLLVLGWTIRSDFYHARVAMPTSCLIAIISCYWVVERTLFY